MAALPLINSERLREHHFCLAAIGATARGGIDRQALTDADTEARGLVVSWAKRRGFALSCDAIGNLFIRRAGVSEGEAAVATGSHLDSQPGGGNFDGVYGVLAGLEVLESLEDAGVATRRPVEVAIWTNEEGSRFSPTTMGSGVYSGAYPLARALESTDGQGVSVAAALGRMRQRLPPCPSRPLGVAPHVYVEAHIEQGPVLEAMGATIGVVTGIQGLRQYRVNVIGREAHAGTTPLRVRSDAFVAARRIAAEAEALATTEGDEARFTIGRFEVLPGTPNTVPGKVTMTIDLRHPDEAALDRIETAVQHLCSTCAAPCVASMETTLAAPPVHFSETITHVVKEVAESLGFRTKAMISGATHDAGFVSRLCPAGMIFIPCRAGVSHNAEEHAEWADMFAGARVLASVLLRLADANEISPPEQTAPAKELK
jgi:beta-ureidopropionase / N-carbamoyl-L-amino-acid hydrolase